MAGGKGDANLKRGKFKPTAIPQPHGGAIAVPGAGKEALVRAREDAARVHAAVLEDPDAAMEEIHASLTVWTRRIVQRGARTSTVPEPAVMNVIREFRQTQEAVNEARRAKGAIVEAREFFEQMDARVATLLRLSPEPVPVAELP